MTVDNGTQFKAESFRTFCHQIGTRLSFASVRHPESKGVVKRANGIILLGISKRLVGLPKGKSVEELSKVLWSHNTTVSRATGFTPFKLLYGEEAMSLEEIKYKSLRAMRPEATEAEQDLAKDMIEATRLEAVENIQRYQAKTKKWRDRKVKLKHIEPGHFVLRRITNADTVGKLQSKWDGPFLVKASNRMGSFRLEDMYGKEVPRSWNINDLRRYYP